MLENEQVGLVATAENLFYLVKAFRHDNIEAAANQCGSCLSPICAGIEHENASGLLRHGYSGRVGAKDLVEQRMGTGLPTAIQNVSTHVIIAS